MKTIYHQPENDIRPKRGDLLQTNVGDRRERTFIILSSHVLPTRWCAEMGITAQRTRLTAARWWEIEPEMRQALYRSAERAGGQEVYGFKRFPAKKKRTFEELMLVQQHH